MPRHRDATPYTSLSLLTRLRNILVEAEEAESSGMWEAARVKYLALMELPPAVRSALLSPANLRTIEARLARPESASVGLCRKLTAANGKTLWVFEDAQQQEHEAPVAGAQTDKRSACPLVLTPSDVLDAALQLANVTATDLVADLGCGDGRLLLRAAQRGARAVGFDVNEYCLRASRAVAAELGRGRVEVIEADIFALKGHLRFEASTVVYAYLIPEAISRLQPLLHHAVASGKRVVVYCRSGDDRERPGNAVDGLVSAAVALGGRLRLYCESSATQL